MRIRLSPCRIRRFLSYSRAARRLASKSGVPRSGISSRRRIILWNRIWLAHSMSYRPAILHAIGGSPPPYSGWKFVTAMLYKYPALLT
jgi:hypothetical protein